jgi:hypothetical protein
VNHSIHQSTVDNAWCRESLTPAIRRLPTPACLALNLIGRLPKPPYLSRDRNGAGREFMRLRYSTGGGQLASLCIGALDTEHEAVLRHVIALRWSLRRHELDRIIRDLRARRRQAQLLADQLASSCGYGFRGWMLHRRDDNES